MAATGISGSAAAGSPEHGHAVPTSFWALTLGTIGVVYGDIGTSPLYALKESLAAATGHAGAGALTREMVLGVVSLILWTLIIIVTIKYVVIVLRADNNGEGGTLSLVTLAQRALGHSTGLTIILGMVGASLFYGDAIITPAISVLSAVEGLKLVTPAFDPYVVPLSLVILITLFAVQRFGTASVARFFGPITAFWFLVMAVGGLMHIRDDPSILAAINPVHGLSFLLNHGTAGLLALGAVFLSVTGAEALYADMGHFGRAPIRTAWLGLVLPALALNYLGQGAMLLAHPEGLENPFFLLYPSWALLPMVILATVATIIASQAVITGAFSISQQAMHLGVLPRFRVMRTSETEKGQIYVPFINWLLLGVIAGRRPVRVIERPGGRLRYRRDRRHGHHLVPAVHRRLEVLALATGCGGAGDRAVPCHRTRVPRRERAQDPSRRLVPAAGRHRPVHPDVDLAQGHAPAGRDLPPGRPPLAEFIRRAESSPVPRVPGTAIFLTGNSQDVPAALLHNLKHNKVLHEQNVILTVVTEEVPRFGMRAASPSRSSRTGSRG